jgi:TP901 family phage tail tape measure protein
VSFTIAYDIKAIDKFSDVADKVYQSMARMDRSLKKVADASNRTTAALKKTGSAAGSNGRKMAAAMDKAGASATRNQKKVRNYNQALAGMGQGMQSAGRTLNRYVTLPLVAAGGASVKFAMDFNKGMANVGTLIPGQRKRLDGFKQSVLGLSQEVGLSAENLQGGLYQTLSAFGTVEDPFKKLELSAKMSRAGLASVTESLNLVSAVTKGYGDTSDAAAKKVGDMAFQAVKDGQTTFPELAASMGRVVPIAAALKVSQKELFAGFSTLTGVTGNAAEVSTQLASVMAAMSKPSAKMSAVVKKLGYSSATVMVKQLGLQRTMLKLSGAVGGSTDALSQMLGRKEALVAMLALTGGQADTFRKKYDAMGKSVGALDAAYKEQMDGINKSGANWDKTKAKIFALAVKIGDKLLPVLDKLINKYIVPLVDKLSNMDDATLESTLKFAGFAMALGPVLTGLGNVTSAVSGSITFFQNLKTVMSGLKTAAVALPSALKAIGVASKTASVGVRALTTAFGAAAVAAAAYYAIKMNIEKSEKKLQKTEDLRTKAMQVAEKGGKTATIQQQQKSLSEVHKLSVKAQMEMWEPGTVTEYFASAFGDDSAFKARAGTAEHIMRTEARLRAGLDTTMGKQMQRFDMAAPAMATQALSPVQMEQLGMAPVAMPEVAGPGITQENLAASEQAVKIDIELTAPEGAVGEIKQKSTGGHADVNVGKNARE